MNADLAARIAALIGESRVRTDSTSLEAYGVDRSTLWQPAPACVVRPQSVAEVQELLRLANRESFAIVPSGGRTGLSGGAVAMQGEVVLSLEALNQIGPVNRADRSITVGAGAITQKVQEAAADEGYFYPVDFASAGSSQIGGNLATNAGGINVIRYGMTRDWVRGLQVVTGSGELLNLNQGLLKNNTGYDLRHLLVGSEGTLGIIVEATLGLTTPPRDRGVLLLAVPDFGAILAILDAARAALPLTAFEFLCAGALARVLQAQQRAAPYATAAAYHLLIEFEDAGEREEQVADLFQSWMDAGWVLDGVAAQSGAEAERLWALREEVSETLSRHRPYKNDISVRISQLPALVQQVGALVEQHYAGWEVIWYGHIGDGNLHLNILPPEGMAEADFAAHCKTASDAIAQVLQQLGGSISAEHGVGLLKKAQLGASRSPEEIRLMQAIKAVFDPRGILNPGKIF